MALGIILVHGYTGSHQNLKPLYDELIAHFGADSVTNLSLPGHDSHDIPAFDQPLFIETIHHAIDIYRNEHRKIILLGHSTGGNLILSTLQQFSITPNLLILVSVPKKINMDYLERWNTHRVGHQNIPMIDVALMVKLINSTGLKRLETDFPLLIIHGNDDKLVLSAEADAWKNESFSQSARVVNIPQADHDIFNGINGHLAIDIIQRAVTDLLIYDTGDSKIIHSLIEAEPDLQDFFTAMPFSKSHLALCPGAQTVIDQKPELLPAAKTDPIIANIEITTYCNLNCQFCARSRLKKRNKHMSADMFHNILTMLPNTYKIVLVGLGEPLLHPQITDFIKYAKLQGKKVGMVTNAMLLNADISSRLLEAGLDSIAFSIDGYDKDLSSLVREGTDFAKVIDNIKNFVTLSNATRRISKAVFSAVSIDTVSHLKDLVDQVSDLGVDVLMLTDINFKANLDHTLWQNINSSADIEGMVRQAVSYAFSKNLPVLSVHGLEEFGLEKRYHDFLMIPPGQLYQRSVMHHWCLSPWQTIPVDIEGNITLCDCQPDIVCGNLFQDAFSEIWNGAIFKKHRTEMLSDNPPEACRICPRF